MKPVTPLERLMGRFLGEVWQQGFGELLVTRASATNFQVLKPAFAPYTISFNVEHFERAHSMITVSIAKATAKIQLAIELADNREEDSIAHLDFDSSPEKMLAQLIVDWKASSAAVINDARCEEMLSGTRFMEADAEMAHALCGRLIGQWAEEWTAIRRQPFI